MSSRNLQRLEKEAINTLLSFRQARKKNGKFMPSIREELRIMMENAPKKNGVSYPTENQRTELALRLSLSMTQVNNFASNYRRRIQKKKKFFSLFTSPYLHK
jgi:hypothetical protein